MKLHDQSYYTPPQNIPVFKIALDGVSNVPVSVSRYTTERLPLIWHMHEYVQINYVHQGKVKHVINDHCYDIMKGDIFVVPPYVPHTLVEASQDDGIIYEFEFEPRFINQNLGNLEYVKTFLDFAYIEPFLEENYLMKPRLNLSSKIQMEVEHILNEAYQEYTQKNEGYELLLKALLMKLLVLVGREFNRNSSNSDTYPLYTRHKEAIMLALDYINANYNKTLSLEDVAKRSMLSQSYFSYLFKIVTSKTFVEYVNDLRISQAMELLRTTNRRVIDICCEVGFNNVNYFNKLFRQQTGVTPVFYRKDCRNEVDISELGRR